MSRQTDNQEKHMDIERIMGLYGDELLRLCYLYVHDWQMAEDVLQDTFISAFRNFHKFQGESSEKTWLTRIAINTCKSYLRTPWKKKVIYQGETPLWNDEKEVAEMEFCDDTVIKAVCQLKPRYREVILLFYYQELKIKEIAGILKISESAVTVRLSRAREQLKGKLERWYYDE